MTTLLRALGAHRGNRTPIHSVLSEAALPFGVHGQNLKGPQVFSEGLCVYCSSALGYFRPPATQALSLREPSDNEQYELSKVFTKESSHEA